MGILELGIPELGILEVGISEVGILEVGIPEVGIPEVSILEVGIPEVGILEVGHPRGGNPRGGPIRGGNLRSGSIRGGQPRGGNPKDGQPLSRLLSHVSRTQHTKVCYFVFQTKTNYMYIVQAVQARSFGQFPSIFSNFLERRWTIIALRNLIFYFWSNIELTWHECSFMSQITNYKEKC